MKKLPICGLIAFGIMSVQATSAQVITNGSFETGDFTGWQTTVGAVPGSPAVLTGGLQPINGTPSVVFTPVNGNFQAFIQSTGGASANQSISATTAQPDLQTFAGLSATGLPNSSIAGGVPINGVAIKQTFTTLGQVRITFSYAYQSRETTASGLDGTGYVLNGVFHSLVDSDTPGVTDSANGVFASSLNYQTTSVVSAAGTNTLVFLAYNTFFNLSTTALEIDNIQTSLLFSTTPGLTPNQSAVATNLDNLTAIGGANPDLIAALTGATTPQALGDFLDQLSPQSLQVFRSIAFNNATFNTLDVTNHLANLRDGLTGFDGSQLSVNDPSLTPGVSRLKNRMQDPKDMHPMRDPKDVKEMQPVAAAEPADRWSTFIVGDVVLADITHDQDLAHQDYTTGSVMLGADYRLDPHFTVGGLLAYSHTDANLDHIGSTATVDSYSPGVYASFVDGGWYGNALATYGYNSYTDDRNIQIGTFGGTNHGATQGNQYTGSLTGGYEFQHDDFKYGPIAGIQYVNLGINSFNENGPTALNVQGQSAESFRSQLGVEARYVVRVGSMSLVPHASASWQHEFLDDSNGITSQFSGIGAGSFTVQTTPVDRDSAVIDVGVNADVTNNVTLFTDYQTEAGASDYFAQSVAAGIKIGF